MKCPKDKTAIVLICSQGYEGWRCPYVHKSEAPGGFEKPEKTENSGHFVPPRRDIYKKLPTLKDYADLISSDGTKLVTISGSGAGYKTDYAPNEIHAENFVAFCTTEVNVSVAMPEGDQKTVCGLKYISVL